VLRTGVGAALSLQAVRSKANRRVNPGKKFFPTKVLKLLSTPHIILIDCLHFQTSLYWFGFFLALFYHILDAEAVHFLGWLAHHQLGDS
jgi:hypothetical protein